jgi:hypothetical protein
MAAPFISGFFRAPLRDFHLTHKALVAATGIPSILQPRGEHSVLRLGQASRRSRATNNTATQENTTRDAANASMMQVLLILNAVISDESL